MSGALPGAPVIASPPEVTSWTREMAVGQGEVVDGVNEPETLARIEGNLADE